MLRYIIIGVTLAGLLAGCNLALDSDSSGLNTPAATRTLPGDAANNPALPTRDATQTTPNSTLSSTLPAATATAASCKPPTNWVEYTIQRGDTLGRIADLTSSSTDELTAANCLDNPNRIRVGQTILVPKAPALPTSLPSSTPPT